MRQSSLQAAEQRILHRFQERNYTEATAAIVEEYGPEILGYLHNTMGKEIDAAEVFAQTCEDLCRGILAFEGRCSFKTWAYKLASSARSRFWKDPYRRRARPLESERLNELIQVIQSSTTSYLRSTVQHWVAQFRTQLDPWEQSLLTLRVDREMSWAEIAEILSGAEDEPEDRRLNKLSEAALRQRFKRLKDRIRDAAIADGLLNIEESR